MKCRWDREAEAYIADGEPCRVDEYGDPTKHCTARRSCAVHIGRDELTCPRCIARARSNLRSIPTLAAFAMSVAVASGVNSPAAHIAGPSAHPVLWSWRRIDARRTAAAAHLSGDVWDEEGFARAVEHIEEDDDRHPAVVIRWAAMIAEDYGHDVPEVFTVSSAADYLERNLARIANDPQQDFPYMARELRKCRQYLETAEALSAFKQRGAPCPECVAVQVDKPERLRLVRNYGHWCDEKDCEQIHYADDTADVWVCPRNREHWWSHADYSRWVEERKGA